MGGVRSRAGTRTSPAERGRPSAGLRDATISVFHGSALPALAVRRKVTLPRRGRSGSTAANVPSGATFTRATRAPASSTSSIAAEAGSTVPVTVAVAPPARTR